MLCSDRKWWIRASEAMYSEWGLEANSRNSGGLDEEVFILKPSFRSRPGRRVCGRPMTRKITQNRGVFSSVMGFF